MFAAVQIDPDAQRMLGVPKSDAEIAMKTYWRIQRDVMSNLT